MTLFDVSQPTVSYYMAYRQKKHQKKKGDLLTQGVQYIKKALKRINWNNLGYYEVDIKTHNWVIVVLLSSIDILHDYIGSIHISKISGSGCGYF